LPGLETAVAAAVVAAVAAGKMALSPMPTLATAVAAVAAVAAVVVVATNPQSRWTSAAMIPYLSCKRTPRTSQITRLPGLETAVAAVAVAAVMGARRTAATSPQSHWTSTLASPSLPRRRTQQTRPQTRLPKSGSSALKPQPSSLSGLSGVTCGRLATASN
jgi:hypothetical protein